MIKNGKKACDYCGRKFQKKTKYVEYNDGTSYHHDCVKKIGGKNDLGRDYVKPRPTRNSSFSAGEVLKQLGGNRFIAMTGAKQFVKDDNKQTIMFKIGRNSKGINYVKIKLNAMDTYDMYFYKIRKFELKEVSKELGVYNDQLQSIFTAHTGLYTRL